MSNLNLFFKKNKKVEENKKYAATKSLVDANGNPLEWEIRKVTSREVEKIRTECTKEVKTANGYRMQTDSIAFLSKYIVAAIVSPDLYDKDLQDSYGVMTPEDLLKEMVDDPVEYNALGNFVQSFDGPTLQDEVDQAKN